MDYHPRLIRHLDTLSVALSDGSDLTAILGVLVDDLTEAVPSFLGMDITWPVTSGVPVTVSSMDQFHARLVRTSLLLPLDRMGAGHPGTAVVYYAASPGEFTDLAAVTRDRYQLDGNVVLDRHLAASGTPGVTGLDELRTINQAIGVLIDQGHTPDSARAALLQSAARRTHTQYEAAAQILSEIGQ